MMETFQYLPFELSEKFNLFRNNNILGPHWPLITKGEILLSESEKCQGPLNILFKYQDPKKRTENSTGGDCQIQLTCEKCQLNLETPGFNWRDNFSDFSIAFRSLLVMSESKPYLKLGKVKKVPYEEDHLFGLTTRIYLKTKDIDIMIVLVPNKHLKSHAWSSMSEILSDLRNVDINSKYDKKQILGF